MSEKLKWRWCSTCYKWRQVPTMQCPACGGMMSVGRISREEKPVDPRLQEPVGNREVKPL